VLYAAIIESFIFNLFYVCHDVYRAQVLTIVAFARFLIFIFIFK